MGSQGMASRRCGQGGRKPGRRRRTSDCRLSQAEVHQLGSRLGQHDVPRFEIAVHDAAAMCFLETFADFDSALQDLFDGQQTLPQTVPQGFAL